MRFREKWLKDKNKYIFWVDTYALFPYDYESVDVYISLWNKNASEVRYLPTEKLSVAEHLMHWLSGSGKDIHKLIKNHCDNVYMCILVNQTTRLLRPQSRKSNVEV